MAAADIPAAFDDAVFNSVNMFSISIGSSPSLADYVEDPVVIGSFHAVANRRPTMEEKRIAEAKAR